MSKKIRLRTKYISCLWVVLFVMTQLSYAGIVQVTSKNDAGAGTLRNAVSTANAGDEITFSSSLNGDSIVLTSGYILINKNLVITGPGANQLVISGAGLSRIFKIDSAVTVTISDVTLRNAKASGATDSGKGGAVFNKGTFHLNKCIISNNHAGYSGGAIYNEGSVYADQCSFVFNSADSSGGAIANIKGYVEILNSTISSNHAGLRGGGLYNLSVGSFPIPEININFCTITQNFADKEGGGIANTFDVYTDTSRIILGSSIVAENQAGTYGVDIFRDLSSRCYVSSIGFNLIGNSDSSGILAVTGDIMGKTNSEISPNLRPLQINGVSLPVHPFDCGSPCLDSGDPFSSLTTDQLGQTRPFYGNNDIGAFESQVSLYIPLIYLGKDIDTCTQSLLSFDASMPGDSVNWFVNSVLKKSNSQLFSYSSGLLDTVVGEAVTPAGCAGYDTLVVRLFDKIKPVISNCPSNMTVPAMPGSCKAVATWAAPTATDNCHIDTIISNYSSGDTFDAGITLVVYKAYDIAGNFDTCFFTVTIQDTLKPLISCGQNIKAFVDTTLCGAFVHYNYPAFSDNCTGAVLKRIAGPDSAALFNSGHTRVLFEVKDAMGNSDSCGFDVFVKDTIKPVIVKPTDIVVGNDKSQCGAIVNFNEPIGTDNCPAATTLRTTGLAPGSMFPVGKTLQTYVVADGQGNSDSTSFIITVEDREKPDINCLSDIKSCEQLVTYNEPKVTDNCPGLKMSRIEGPASGSTFPYGSTKIRYVATDSANNADSCTFYVNVYHKPEIDLMADTTIYYGDKFVISPLITNANTYEWNPVTWLSDAFIPDPETQPEEDIDYILKAGSSEGCTAFDTISIHVIYEFIIPSAFTPDGDHVNDSWEIKGLIKFPDAEIFIYDRWGKEIFHSIGYEEKWDGTLDGKDLPIDSYYYILLLNDGSDPQKGTVTIIR